MILFAILILTPFFLDRVMQMPMAKIGLIMMTMMQNAFANTSSSIVIAKVQGNIVDVLMPPLSAGELTLGMAAGGVTRGVMVGVATGLAMWIFVPLRIHDPAILLFHAVNASLMLSLLGMIGGIWSERFDHIAAVTNFVITPLSFLSGTFYSIERLPENWQFAAHLNPFFYLIDGMRYGFIGRAENRAMVKYLKIKVSRLNRLKTERRQAYALVDTQPGSGNNSLPAGIKPLIVIDHHPLRRQTSSPFLDVRPDYGASATIIAEYLLASGLPVTAQIATAIAYAIISETEDLGREASLADIEAYLRIFPKANQRTLSRIRHPKLPGYYFASLQKALANAFTYRNVIGSRLGNIEHPDIVPQVADLLLATERMGWCICTGRYKDEIYVSIRTINVKAESGRLLRRVVNRKGTAGGHGMIAGGRISCRGLSETECEKTENEIIGRFLEKLGHRGEIMFKPLLTL